MLLKTILSLHITLAVLVFGAFIFRYAQVFKNKTYPKKGRKVLLSGSILLVISGVGLSGVGHLPITGLCLDSLGLITALIVLELGLQKLGGRLEASSKKIHNHD